jgi:D-glycero-D-manno-heptose 1,7-bisphosphate phosphatase
MKAVFLDRDGTINAGIPFHERVDSVDKVQLLPNTLQALRELAELDYAIFIITNQAGISEGRITLDQFNDINNEVLRQISSTGINVHETYLCPHSEDATCDCRKPKPKLLQDAAKQHGVDLAASWMIGDRPSDVLTGVNAGTRTILVMTGAPDAIAPQANFTAPSLLEAVRYIADNSKKNTGYTNS